MAGNQQEYYRLLGEADRSADCSGFIHFLLGAVKQALEEAIASQTPDVSVEMSVQLSVETQQMILQVLSKQPSLSLAKVAPLVGKSVRTVERVAARLQKEGKLEHVEPRKGGHWVAKE